MQQKMMACNHSENSQVFGSLAMYFFFSRSGLFFLCFISHILHLNPGLDLTLLKIIDDLSQGERVTSFCRPALCAPPASYMVSRDCLFHPLRAARVLSNNRLLAMFPTRDQQFTWISPYSRMIKCSFKQGDESLVFCPCHILTAIPNEGEIKNTTLIGSEQYISRC